MIVIDVGAQAHAPEESTYFLADHFHPELLCAFDGYHGFKEGMEEYGVTTIIRRRQAAWITNGFQHYSDRGMCSAITHDGEDEVVTFDLADFIRRFENEQVILKLDCEGAEYVLLPHLVNEGVDKQISLLLIEWHPPHLANGWYAPRPPLSCKVVDWNDLTGLETEAEPT